MIAAALALALIGPGRASAVADAVTPGTPGTVPLSSRTLESLPPELRKKLEDLLQAIESGRANALTGAEVRGLLAQLDELRGGKPADNKAKRPEGPQADPATPATQADLKALAERTKKASENASLQPETRDALSEMSDDLSDAAAEAKKNAPRICRTPCSRKKSRRAKARDCRPPRRTRRRPGSPPRTPPAPARWAWS